jgi:hypothetical protein
MACRYASGVKNAAGAVGADGVVKKLQAGLRSSLSSNQAYSSQS